jgi:hypothetical protein
MPARLLSAVVLLAVNERFHREREALMTAESDVVGTRIQLFCVWAGPLMAVLYLIFFGAIAGFIPPPSPHWSANHVATFFAQNRSGIRVGQIGGLVASTLLFPFFSVISAQIARIERRQPVLAMMQFGGAVLLEVFFALCAMLWVAATFRPELGASTVRVLNDLGWLIFVMVFPAYTMQMICIAIAGFRDRSPDPIWPRWACYFNIWVGVGGMGGGIAVFFKHGPFAWNGLIGFYAPIAIFFSWLCVMTYLMHTGIRRQAAEERRLDAPARREEPQPQAVPA